MRGKAHQNQITFNGGEASEKMSSRVDLAKYQSMALSMENGSINKQGELEKRIGTEYIGEVKFSDTKTRLIPFEFSRTTFFVLELGDYYMRFYSNGVRVPYISGDVIPSGLSVGDPVELVTPWGEDEIFDVQYRQINDIMYLVHPDHKKQKLSRTTDTQWTIADVDDEPPAFLDENLDKTIWIWSNKTTGTGATLTSSSAIFKNNHVGSIWQIRHTRDSDQVEIDLDATRTSSTLKLIGEWNFRTYGFWDGDIELQTKGDQDLDWRTIRKFSGEYDRNVDAVPLDGGNPDEAQYRIKFTATGAWTPPSGVTEIPRAVLEATDAFIGGLVKITAVPSGAGPHTTCTADIIEDLEKAFPPEASADAAKTTYWSEPLWSDERGWPACIDIFEDRIWHSGSEDRPLNFQASKTGDYENFDYGQGNADDAMNKRISARQQNPVQWIDNLNGLLLATKNEIWGYLTEDGGSLTPDTGAVRRQTSVGAKNIQPVNADEALIYIHSDGKRVYELAQDGASVINRHVANEMTILSGHATGTGVTQMQIEREPETKVYCVTSDGMLAVMVYERSHEVVGWTRYTTDGDFESVAVTGEEVWVIVNRDNGRFVERFSTTDWENTSQKDAPFVDSHLTFGPGGSGNITNITSARPPVVTVDVATGLANDDLVRIDGVVGPTELNGQVFTVKNLSGLNFELYNENGTDPIDIRVRTSFEATHVTNGQTYTIPGHHFAVGDIVSVYAPGPPPFAFPVASVTGVAGDDVTLNYPNSGGGTIAISGRFLSLIKDGSTAYSTGGTWEEVYASLSGLDHLEGQTVQVFADGAIEGQYEVSSGAITLGRASNCGVVGLPYTMLYQSMRLDASQQLGNLQGTVRRISEVVVRIENSGIFEYSADGSTWFPARLERWGDDYGDTPQFMDEDVRLSWPGRHDYLGYVYIRQASALPLRIKGITIKYEVTGR